MVTDLAGKFLASRNMVVMPLDIKMFSPRDQRVLRNKVLKFHETSMRHGVCMLASKVKSENKLKIVMVTLRMDVYAVLPLRSFVLEV